MESTHATDSTLTTNITIADTQTNMQQAEETDVPPREQTSTVRYQDCLLGKVGMPSKHHQKTWFQLLSIGAMIPITVTLNWLISTPVISWEAFERILYMYPLTAFIVIAVRFLIANPILDRVVKSFVSPHVTGLKRALSVSFINIIFVGTIVSFIKAIITLEGLARVCWECFASSLPLSFLISFIVGYFFISPAMKKMFAASDTWPHPQLPQLGNPEIRLRATHYTTQHPIAYSYQ